jgi:hypothetical protein
VWGCTDRVVGTVSIGSFELSRWRLRRTRWAMGFQSVRAGCRVSLKQPTETKRDMALFLNIALEHGLVTERAVFGGLRCRVSVTRAWRAGTHLRETLIETSCAIGISGGIKTAPLWIRHGQGLEIKLGAGQPFNNEHGTGAHRTSQMSGCVRLVCAVRAEQIAAA